MARGPFYACASFATLLIALGAPSVAPAADAAPSGPKDATSVGEIVVTGSLIAGTPKTTAIPVQVLTQVDLQKQGAPTVLELIKELPIVGSVLGDSNQFSTNAQGRVGGGTLNLRALGSTRTLVLLNGRRFSGPSIYGSDTNLIPEAAIGRVEILKDGAAATYGSDAIGGVVNFITRTNFRGLELNGDYREVPGSKGDYTASALWGWGNETQNLLVSFGYQHRSELSDTKRSYVDAPYNVNPSGWSVLGNPGDFTLKGGPAGTGSTVGFAVDSNCQAVGGALGYTGNTPLCRFSYLPFDNLVEDQDFYQGYAEFNSKIGDSSKLHVEAMYSQTNIPNIRFSPGYPPTSGPSGPGSVNVYSVPASNPGFNSFLTQTGNAALIGTAQSALATLWRPLGNGGNNSTGGLGGQSGSREYDELHLSSDLSGDTGFFGIRYDLAGTFIRESQDQQTTDILITRLQNALNGFGGTGCSGTTPGANGCQYFNPFSNAYPGNPALGLSNPGYVSANANSPALISSLFDRQHYQAVEDTYVIDGSLSAKLPIRLPGGQVALAVGGQYRNTDFRQAIPDPLYDARITPCPVVGATNCAFPTGPYIFLGQNQPLELKQNVYAIFGELDIPFTDRINGQLGLRYEDYGSLTGSTFNPQFRAKWQVLDWFAIRGSIGTSFRGPTPQDASPTGTTGLSAINAAGGNFKSVDFFGSPNVKPESAVTYSVGVIAQYHNLSATLDYFHYKVENQITTVPANIVATAVGGVGNGSQAVDCSSPLRYLITFDNGNSCTQGVTNGNDIARVRSDTTNGPTLNTDGIDVEVNYQIPDVWKGEVNFGANFSYVLSYDEGAFTYNKIVVSPAYSAVGSANYDRFPGTVPTWRGQFFAEYHKGRHNLRWTVNYIDGVDDNRGPTVVQTGPSTNCTVANQIAGTATNCQLVTFGLHEGSFISNDAVYRLELPYDTTLTLALLNVFDEAPAQARIELSYDPFIGSPIGRTFKIGLRKKF
jgi:iron complex outermembrane receptor protein